VYVCLIRPKRRSASYPKLSILESDLLVRTVSVSFPSFCEPYHTNWVNFFEVSINTREATSLPPETKALNGKGFEAYKKGDFQSLWSL